MEKATRLRHLDALRGICAILVVMLHAIPKQWLGMGLLHFDSNLYVDIGRIGVACFFLISGYVIPFSIPKGESPVRRFWVARFFRLWPAYWAAILVWSVLVERPPIKELAVNLTMLQGFVGIKDVEGVFWTLQIELVFYFVVTAFIVMGKVRSLETYRTSFYVMIGMSFLLAVARMTLHKPLPVALAMGLTLMFMSATIRQLRLAGRPMPWGMVAWYVVTLVPICLLGYTIKFRDWNDPYRWMLAYGLGLALFLTFERMSDAPGFAVYLGAISYSVYLLHPVALALVERAIPGLNPIALLVVVLGLTIAVASVVFYLVEKPSQRLGKTLAARLKPKEKLELVSASKSA